MTVVHLSNGAESPDVKKANCDLDLECLEPKSPEGTARVKIASPFDIVPDQDDDFVLETDVKTSSRGNGQTTAKDVLTSPLNFRASHSTSPSSRPGKDLQLSGPARVNFDRVGTAVQFAQDLQRSTVDDKIGGPSSDVPRPPDGSLSTSKLLMHK